jgi:hypothetical protein
MSNDSVQGQPSLVFTSNTVTESIFSLPFMKDKFLTSDAALGNTASGVYITVPCCQMLDESSSLH